MSDTPQVSPLLVDWKTVLNDTYEDFFRVLAESLPQFIGAFALLILGWVIARVLRTLAHKIIHGFDAMLLRTGKNRPLGASQLKSYAHWIGNIIFWSVLLFFVAASSNLLQWKVLSDLASTILAYLPNLLTGLLIILAGFSLSGFARSATTSAAHSAGIGQANLLATLAQFAIIFTAIVIGVEQLGINIAFLTTALIVIIGVLLSGIALAFGLGAKEYVANIIAVQVARKHYRSGQQLKISDITGELLEITATTIVLDTENGKATIPAKFINNHICEILTESATETSIDSTVDSDSKPNKDV